LHHFSLLGFSPFVIGILNIVWQSKYKAENYFSIVTQTYLKQVFKGGGLELFTFINLREIFKHLIHREKMIVLIRTYHNKR